MVMGTRTLVDSQPDPAYTIRGISPFASNQCFVVTAYKGSHESLDSISYCASALSLGTEEKGVSGITGSLSMNTSKCGPDQGVALPLQFELDVGIRHFVTKDCSGQRELEGLMYFNYPFVIDHFVRKATLTLTFNSLPTCADTLGQTTAWNWHTYFKKNTPSMAL